MARKKEIYKDKKWLVHSLNVQEYKDYTLLIKGCIEFKKYEKGKSLKNTDKKEYKYFKNINMFFVIYNTFMPSLKLFKSSKAINLYIHCGLTMDYECGYLKEDLKEISDLFNCTQRVVYKWLRQLEDMGLIFTKKHKGEKYIFIKPYDIECKDNFAPEDSFRKLVFKYKKWVKMNRKLKTLFFSIHTNFKEYLYTISGGALKLYIYCGLSTNKSTKTSIRQNNNNPKKMETSGTFFQSLNLISEKLSRERSQAGEMDSPAIKTICGWFKELKQLNLVEKYQLELNRPSTTYVKPLVKIKDLQKYKWITELENFEYIGNVTTKVLHHKNCKWVKGINENTKAISKSNKIYFAEIKIALNQNFKQCKDCLVFENANKTSN
ncbi:hypothetical protein [Clostridium sp.]|uniref:hypothetical protein n=1 Tax=Clostridium sp. TaxID=1506 RepID=UPI003D6C96C9